MEKMASFGSDMAGPNEAPWGVADAMCVATVLLNTGIVPMTEPTTQLLLEAPGGLIEIT